MVSLIDVVDVVDGMHTEPWALKELHPSAVADANVVAGFQAEAYRTAALHHPHIVAARAFDSGASALGLAYVDGVSLAYLLDASRIAGSSLPPSIVVRIGLDVLSALAAVHAVTSDQGEAVAGLVHGDVNPRNVLVDRAGTAWLCDFGAAAPAYQIAPFRGTWAYAAPEVLTGRGCYPASDVFSAAVMLWEALRGQRLFRRTTAAETMMAVVETPAEVLDVGRPDLRALADCFRAALRTRIEERTATAAVFARALTDAQSPASRADVGTVVTTLAAVEFARRQNPALASVRSVTRSSR